VSNQKRKKAIAKKVLDEVVKNYDFKQEVTTPLEVLLGIESQLPTASIMNLDEMGRFIEGCKKQHSIQIEPKKVATLCISRTKSSDSSMIC